MKKEGKKKRIILIIVLVCLAFIAGMFIYKIGGFSGKTSEKAETEKKEVKSKPSALPPKKKPVDAVPNVVEPIEQEAMEPATDSENNSAEDVIPEPSIPAQAEDVPEPTSVYIPQTKTLFSRSDLSLNDLPERKVHYSGSNGKLESVIIRNQGKIMEHLTSYNALNELVDNLEIGLIDEDSVRKKYATISQNKITTFEIIPGKDGKDEESVTRYSITPELRFVKGKTYKKIAPPATGKKAGGK